MHKLPTETELRAHLQQFDLQRLADAGLARDPGNYNLLVHLVPPEVAKDRAADSAIAARLLQPPGPIGLYLHIAPCTGRCTFCHYAIEVNPSDAALHRYLRALETEMALRWTQLDPASVQSVLIGGGTPTYLEPAQLDRLLTRLRQIVALPAGIEFTCEGAPETITAEKLAVLRQHGVTRFSLGVQSFDDGLLRLLGRRHDGKGARAALELVQNAGFEHCNLDLIYMLPTQTLPLWLGDVQVAIDAGVDSLTTYHLRKRPDTVISRSASPATDLSLIMHLGALRRLEAAGYRQSLVDYFCKAELATAQVQARDKWRDMQPVDGCGAEACSRRPDVVAFAPSDPQAYAQAVEINAPLGQLPLASGRFLSLPEQMAQRAMFALKVLDADGGLDRTGFAAEFGVTVDAAFGPVVAQLCALGVLDDDGKRLRLTLLGTLHADEVCAKFWTDELRRQMAARVKVDATGAAVPVPRGTQREAIETADVVVIGAGIGGLAAAVALAQDLGAGVLVCEAADEVGQGATAASIGGFRIQSDDPVWAELTTLSLPVYTALAAGPQGETVGMARSGYLFLAHDDADVALYTRQAAIAAQFGDAVLRLAPHEIGQAMPGLHTADLLGAWWGQNDGQVDPHGIARLWRAQLLRRGARIRLGQAALGLKVAKGRVVGVHTAQGTIAAGAVVLAAGAATAGLLQSAGVQLPLRHGKRRMVLGYGSGLPTTGPLVMSRQPPLYFRPDAGGVLISARELADDHSEDWLHVAADRAMQRMPVLRQARFRPAWSGVQTHSPDGRPLVGPCPGLDGLYLVAALGGAGVMHAPELGRIAAQWVMGHAAQPLAQLLDPRRLVLTK